ncbi:ester cyclase [Nocardia sp. NPDC052566]|uniref:ester cyclase n=1 Tax=Nocardia sp. NPDC052566 TaxID=3364330 RepID=UPI0037C88FC7
MNDRNQLGVTTPRAVESAAGHTEATPGSAAVGPPSTVGTPSASAGAVPSVGATWPDPRGLVATALPARFARPGYTERELRNIELILALRAASFAQRKRFMHPQLRHHRRGFGGLATMTGLGADGYTARSIGDRVDTVEDIVAKDDRVWAVWTLRGTHTGPLFGIPATGRKLAILEAGIWRIEGELVAEAWFFGDELALLQQLGVQVELR